MIYHYYEISKKGFVYTRIYGRDGNPLDFGGEECIFDTPAISSMGMMYFMSKDKHDVKDVAVKFKTFFEYIDYMSDAIWSFMGVNEDDVREMCQTLERMIKDAEVQ